MKNNSLWFEKIGYIMMFCGAVYPPVLNIYPILLNLFQLLRAVSFLLILYIYMKKEISPSKYTLMILFFYGALLFSTVVNKGYFIRAAFSFISAGSLLLWVEYSVDKKFFYSISLFVLEIVIYINVITIFVFPINHPAYEFAHFFGNRNTHIQYYLPALVIAAVCREKNVYKTRSTILSVVIVIATLYLWSATSLVGIFLFFAVYGLRKAKNSNFLNSVNAYIVYIVLNLGIVVFRIQDIFAFIITNVLKRNLTLTSRTYLWDKTIAWIKQSPWIGYGFEENIYRSMKYGTSIFRAHNQLLEYIYLGGLVALFFYVAYHFCVCKKLYAYRKFIVAKVLLAGVFSASIITISEVHDSLLLLIIFSLSYNIDRVIKLEIVSNKPHISKYSRKCLS